ASACLFTGGVAHAHHGQEFFLLYDARIPAAGHGLLQSNFSYSDEGEDDSFSLSPGISWGILPRTSFNLKASFTDDAGEGWDYQAIEPGLQFDLPPRRWTFPVRVGLAVSYQFAEDAGGSLSKEASSGAVPQPASEAHDHSTASHNHNNST